MTKRHGLFGVRHILKSKMKLPVSNSLPLASENSVKHGNYFQRSFEDIVWTTYYHDLLVVSHYMGPGTQTQFLYIITW